MSAISNCAKANTDWWSKGLKEFILNVQQRSEVINMCFAENLIKSRNKKDLTQEVLAELLGVSRQTVSQWEQGTVYPKVDTLIKLAKELEVSLDWLFAEELAKSEDIEVQQKMLPGTVAGLETFASSISSIMEELL